MLTSLEDVQPASNPSAVVNTAACLKGTRGTGQAHVHLALIKAFQFPIAVSLTIIVAQG